MKYISAKSIFYLLFCACAVVFVGIGISNTTGAQVKSGDNAEQEKTINQLPNLSAKFDRLIEKARNNGVVRVIVGVKTTFQPEGRMSERAAEQQRTSIRQAQNNLLEKLQGRNVTSIDNFEFIPFLVLKADADALELMKNLSDVSYIEEDELMAPALERSTALIGAPAAWNAGFSGAGRTVAVMDTGVDKNHPFFGGRVVSEACYSTTDASEGATSNCPGGVAASTAPNSGLNCNVNVAEGCMHGTHVAGIVGGRANNISRYGVARDVNLIAIQVFTMFSGSNCGGSGSCTLSFTSDQIKGLERVYALRNTYTIDAVNVSIGGGRYTANCDAQQAAYKAAIDNLRSANIATIIASGNSGYTDSLAAPACISTAVSVGSTHDGDAGTPDSISSFSNSASFLTILAPGQLITSAYPGGTYEATQGTSMAAPHVAGAWAVVRQKYPSYTVDQILQKLISTGKNVTDTRNNITKKRIRLDRAVDILPAPTGPCAGHTPIAYNQIVNAQLQAGGCVEEGRNRARYSFYGVEGQPISIAMNSAAFDTYLYLYDSTYDVIAENDDIVSGVNTNSRIPVNGTFTLPSTGTFYIAASSYDPNITGAFNLTLTGTPTVPPVTNRPQFDFDGDGKADVSVFRPSTGAWYLQQSQNGFTGITFGQNGDKIVPADYDGDGKSDVAVFRGGTWYLNRSQLGFTGVGFGAATDIPVPTDYDGDGKSDVAVFRPSTGTWYIQGSQIGFYGIAFGQNGDRPVAADYDGDGKSDVAIYRNGVWYLNRSQLGFIGITFGDANDKAVPADYDGDGKTDVAVFRPSTGTWYLNRSQLGFTGIAFGVSTDVPAPADYDGDGKTDVAVFRSGSWYLNRSTAGFTGIGFGAATDNPASGAYVR